MGKTKTRVGHMTKTTSGQTVSFYEFSVWRWVRVPFLLVTICITTWAFHVGGEDCLELTVLLSALTIATFMTHHGNHPVARARGVAETVARISVNACTGCLEAAGRSWATDEIRYVAVWSRLTNDQHLFVPVIVFDDRVLRLPIAGSRNDASGVAEALRRAVKLGGSATEERDLYSALATDIVFGIGMLMMLAAPLSFAIVCPDGAPLSAALAYPAMHVGFLVALSWTRSQPAQVAQLRERIRARAKESRQIPMRSVRSTTHGPPDAWWVV